MHPSQFDQVTRLFTDRRVSRRRALAAGGGLAALGLSGATAQDATPEGGADDGAHFLFVQTFGAGSLAPKDGDDTLLTLTADHLAGQTVYFSDRPERIVGMVATEQFLGLDRQPDGTPEAGLGFTPADPPNAALVFASAAGESEPGDVVVVELIDPAYDPATGKVTYDVRVLADETAVDLTLQSEPVTAADAVRQFKGASLFIDDCPDGDIVCVNETTGARTTIQSMEEPVGYCWDSGLMCCLPCAGVDYWTGQCYQLIYDCGGGNTCYATWDWQIFDCAVPTGVGQY